MSQPSALIDERIVIKVTGLDENQPITLKASLSEGSMKFASYGCFTADHGGKVDLSKNPSTSGTYTGINCTWLS